MKSPKWQITHIVLTTKCRWACDADQETGFYSRHPARMLIRAALILARLRSYEDLETIFIWSGQHYSDNLKSIFFRELGIAPAEQLGLRRRNRRRCGRRQSFVACIRSFAIFSQWRQCFSAIPTRRPVRLQPHNSIFPSFILKAVCGLMTGVCPKKNIGR